MSLVFLLQRKAGAHHHHIGLFRQRQQIRFGFFAKGQTEPFPAVDKRFRVRTGRQRGMTDVGDAIGVPLRPNDFKMTSGKIRRAEVGRLRR